MTATDWIQAISMVVLVGVTIVYALRTHAISKATREQADTMRETISMSVRPVVAFEGAIFWNEHGGTVLEPYAAPSRMRLTISNMGKGSAFNLTIRVECTNAALQYEELDIPILAANDAQEHDVTSILQDKKVQATVDHLLITARHFDEFGQGWRTIQRIGKGEAWEQGKAGFWTLGEILVEKLGQDRRGSKSDSGQAQIS